MFPRRGDGRLRARALRPRQRRGPPLDDSRGRALGPAHLDAEHRTGGRDAPCEGALPGESISAPSSGTVKRPPVSCFFITSPGSADAQLPSASRRSRTRLKRSDWSAEKSNRCSRRSRGPRSRPASQARARSGLSPSRPKRCEPKVLGTPVLPNRKERVADRLGVGGGEIAEDDGEAVTDEVPRLEFVVVARRRHDRIPERATPATAASASRAMGKKETTRSGW